MAGTASNIGQSVSPVFRILTLGHFDVTKDGQSLVIKASDSKKIWELYKFMITHRDQSFTPESLSDHLWISEEYADPRSTLRRQMYRLRQLLDEHAEDTAETTMIFSNGYYSWNPNVSVVIDSDEFERLVLHGDSKKETDPERSIADLIEAISIYKGDYLPDCIEQHWVFPVRNYYQRLFNKAVITLIDLLKGKDDYDEIVNQCQAAIKIDVYEIDFHIAYIHALHKKGNQKQALEHYQHITNFLYREMGIKPTGELKEIYKLLLKAHPVIQTDKGSLMDALDEHADPENAFYCDPEVFKSIYELERRRSQRSGNGFSIAVLEMKPASSDTLGQKRHKMTSLKEHLLKHLRKGDSLTQWNDIQFVILLSGVDGALMEKVIHRVLDDFDHHDDVIIDQITQLTSDLKPQESN
jgi:DNA-binding SARP family transcriptional activator